MTDKDTLLKTVVQLKIYALKFYSKKNNTISFT